MRALDAKLNHEFCAQDFLDFPVWVTYYEPDDIDVLVQWGYDRRELECVLALIRNNDEYSFPLPPQAAEAPVHYLYLGVGATTRGGHSLIGYFTGPCFGVFFEGKTYQFNRSLAEHASIAAVELAEALGEKAVFPMQVEIMATGERKEVDFY